MIQKKVTSGIHRYHVQSATVRSQTTTISCNNMFNHLDFILDDDGIITAKKLQSIFDLIFFTLFGYWLRSYRVVIRSYFCIWVVDLPLISIRVYIHRTLYSRVLPCSPHENKICFIILWDCMRQYSRLFQLLLPVCYYLPKRICNITCVQQICYNQGASIKDLYLCTLLTKISIFHFTALLQDYSSCQCWCTRWEQIKKTLEAHQKCSRHLNYLKQDSIEWYFLSFYLFIFTNFHFFLGWSERS